MIFNLDEVNACYMLPAPTEWASSHNRGLKTVLLSIEVLFINEGAYNFMEINQSYMHITRYSTASDINEMDRMSD